MDAKLQDLQSRKDQAYNAGSPRSVERQHEKGKLLARERLAIKTCGVNRTSRGHSRAWSYIMDGADASATSSCIWCWTNGALRVS